MHMAPAHAHILLCVRNPSEVNLQRQEEVHVALRLLHVLFPLQLCDLTWQFFLQLHKYKAEILVPRGGGEFGNLLIVLEQL